MHLLNAAKLSVLRLVQTCVLLIDLVSPINSFQPERLSSARERHCENKSCAESRLRSENPGIWSHWLYNNNNNNNNINNNNNNNNNGL